ncbi:MAG: 30S ribosomal protein S4 [Candidatus Hydrothermarchaeota archaeon]
MGDPRKIRKKYETPAHPWQKTRLEEESELIKRYGLKNKREIWRAKTMLRRFRSEARTLLALDIEEREQIERDFLNKLIRYGLLEEDSKLEDVLGLKLEDLLERRLQTLVHKKGLARTPKQSRQLIVHGHITVGDRKVTKPSYMVLRDEENLLSHAKDSPFKSISQEVSKNE